MKSDRIPPRRIGSQAASASRSRRCMALRMPARARAVCRAGPSLRITVAESSRAANSSPVTPVKPVTPVTGGHIRPQFRQMLAQSVKRTGRGRGFSGEAPLGGIGWGVVGIIIAPMRHKNATSEPQVRRKIDREDGNNKAQLC